MYLKSINFDSNHIWRAQRASRIENPFYCAAYKKNEIKFGFWFQPKVHS